MTATNPCKDDPQSDATATKPTNDIIIHFRGLKMGKTSFDMKAVHHWAVQVGELYFEVADILGEQEKQALANLRDQASSPTFMAMMSPAARATLRSDLEEFAIDPADIQLEDSQVPLLDTLDTLPMDLPPGERLPFQISKAALTSWTSYEKSNKAAFKRLFYGTTTLQPLEVAKLAYKIYTDVFRAGYFAFALNCQAFVTFVLFAIKVAEGKPLMYESKLGRRLWSTKLMSHAMKARAISSLCVYHIWKDISVQIPETPTSVLDLNAPPRNQQNLLPTAKLCVLEKYDAKKLLGCQNLIAPWEMARLIRGLAAEAIAVAAAEGSRMAVLEAVALTTWATTEATVEAEKTAKFSYRHRKEIGYGIKSINILGQVIVGGAFILGAVGFSIPGLGTIGEALGDMEFELPTSTADAVIEIPMSPESLHDYLAGGLAQLGV